ncbi:MAG: hypothetical protein ACC628_14950 [Pirellulaceae bacterium]
MRTSTRLSPFRFVLPAGLLVLLCGCAGSDTPGPDEPVDITKEESLLAKKIVLDFAQQYKTEPKWAKATLQEMVENLEGLDAGPNAETVDQILEVVRQLMENYDQASRGKVAELVKLAEQIPGDVSELGLQGE